MSYGEHGIAYSPITTDTQGVSKIPIFLMSSNQDSQSLILHRTKRSLVSK